MADVKKIDGDITVSNAKVAMVVGRFNGFIVESLLAAAVDTLQRAGIASGDITVSHVPGALEIPLVVQTFAASGEQDAVIALGAVIRGSTRILISLRARAPTRCHRLRWHIRSRLSMPY